MCGIVGIMYGPDGPESEEWTPSELMQIMLPASVHRGPHAWGWMSYSGGDTIDYQKGVGRVDTPKALRSMDIPDNADWVVGHVRWATHGSPSELINNHPILHGNVIGVHNGVIRNYMDILKQTGREDDSCEVDSEAIFAAINKWGIKPGLSRIEGDMVAVFVERDRADVLKIARTKGRPLFLAKTTAGSTIFASEEKIIATPGIETTAPSGVMMNRILTLREGDITHRGNIIQRPPEIPPHRFEHIPGLGWTRRDHRGPTSERMAKARAAAAEAASDVPEWPEDGTVSRPGLVWYNGMEVPTDLYIQLKADEVDV